MALTKIVLNKKSVNDIMDVVESLRESNCVQGRDFDFAYHPRDESDYNNVVERHAVFTFYTEKWATWFSLRYL